MSGLLSGGFASFTPRIEYCLWYPGNTKPSSGGDATRETNASYGIRK
jgi:hypothetical protein